MPVRILWLLTLILGVNCSALSRCAGGYFCLGAGSITRPSESQEESTRSIDSRVPFSEDHGLSLNTASDGSSGVFRDETPRHSRTWVSSPGNRAVSSLDWVHRWEKAIGCLSSRELENVDLYEMDEHALTAFWDRVWGCYVSYANG
ncbi:hypothetical protein BDV28DRAFT_158348 [Aspergillus coremiiformis]|uniref:Uncharacterized protein n=1 Tax=Aspergillus coremiiformis TaxID=138285 RepID=A0A5N6Z2L0_9EURO|nr:hypothetical protein BDV28DRAFT_158348 [Aspergillus coremiiformis]